MRPRCAALVTRDAALYAELAPALAERGFRTISLVPGDRIPEKATVVLTGATEVSKIRHPRIVAFPPKGDRIALWAVVEASLRGEENGELIVGVDPGPRPGFAVTAGQATLAQGNLESPEDAARLGQQLKRAFSGRTIRFRVGSGDRPSRDRIVNSLIPLRRPVELVDEQGTTPRGHRRPRDATSAKYIARSPGRLIESPMELSITPGEIANLQRLSREHSGGRLTISRSVADRVLRGELTITEAITTGSTRTRESVGRRFKTPTSGEP